jgi:hypothetical protein
MMMQLQSQLGALRCHCENPDAAGRKCQFTHCRIDSSFIAWHSSRYMSRRLHSVMTLQNPGMITAATAEPLAKITFVPKETVPLPLEVPLYKHFEIFCDPVFRKHIVWGPRSFTHSPKRVIRNSEIAASVPKRHAAK